MTTRTAAPPRRMTQKRATELLASIRTSLANAEACIIELIKGRAWEVLGYETFTQMWNVEFKGIRLATELLRAHIIYAMFDEGASPGQVARQTAGRVGEQEAEKYLQKYRNGTPPEVATTRVRAHDRVLPSEPKYVHIEVLPSELETWKGIAEARGLNFQVEAKKALAEHFRAVERRRA
jgi:hypothetical protein